MSALEQLFWGDISPFDAAGRLDLCDRPKLDAYIKASDALKSKLDPSLHREYEAVLDLFADCGACESAKSFIEGYRLGSRIMLEVLGDRRAR